jgi:hypothetical protein
VRRVQRSIGTVLSEEMYKTAERDTNVIETAHHLVYIDPSY